jgi:hypothetical protein
MFEIPEQAVALTLYTDAALVRGTLRTRLRRVSDILNIPERPFLVLQEVTVQDFGASGPPLQADFAQVNLAAVLFAVADTPVAPQPELRTVKVSEPALVTVPPFRITGRIHLLPERNLRDALDELVGRFIPVTDAVFWSDALGHARTPAIMLAVNQARAQILCPYRNDGSDA